MLKIKHTHHLSLPQLPVLGEPLQFAPISVEDNDELTAAIENDVADRDNAWELNERPDMGELTAFWNTVEEDVANDPSWFKFSED